MGIILLIFTILTFTVFLKWIITDMDAVLDKVTSSLFEVARDQKLVKKASFWGWVTAICFVVEIIMLIIILYRA